MGENIIKKYGISFITLVIVVVVIIILAGTITVILSKNNVFEEAKKSTFVKEMTELEEIVKLVENTNFDVLTGLKNDIFKEDCRVKKEDALPDTLKIEIMKVRDSEDGFLAGKTDSKYLNEFNNNTASQLEIYYIDGDISKGIKQKAYIFDKDTKTVFKVKQTKIYGKVYHSLRWYQVENNIDGRGVEIVQKQPDEYLDDLKNKLEPENIEGKTKEEIDNILKEVIDSYKCPPITYYEPKLLGDLDGDSKITHADVYILLEYLVGSRTLTEVQIVQADFNLDGKIDTTDALAILKSDGYKREYVSICSDDLIYGDINEWILQEGRENRIIGYKGTKTQVVIPNVLIKDGKKIYIIEVGNGSNIFEYGVAKSAVNITSIQISKGIRSIGNSAFSGCTGITEIVIPDSIETLGSNFLYGCTNIVKMTIPNSMMNVESYSWGSSGPWFGVEYKNTHVKEIILKGGITKIPNNTFYGYTALEKITIPSTVTTIGTNAFYNCSNLTMRFLGSVPSGEPWGAKNYTITN